MGRKRSTKLFLKKQALTQDTYKQHPDKHQNRAGTAVLDILFFEDEPAHQDAEQDTASFYGNHVYCRGDGNCQRMAADMNDQQ